MNYQAWLKRVEQWLYVHIGLGFDAVRGQPDYDRMYAAQVEPRVAAYRVLQAEGYGKAMVQ